MTTGRKLCLLGVLIAGLTAWFAWQGAAGSWQYYLTADECLARGPSLAGTRVRVSGKVASESLRVAPDRREAAFALQGSEGRLAITCLGPLPDNLAENIEVVVEGRLDAAGLLRAEKVLTRCASKYDPKAAPADARASPPEEAAP